MNAVPDRTWKQLAFLWRDLALIPLSEIDRGWKTAATELGRLFNAPRGTVGMIHYESGAPRGKCIVAYGADAQRRKTTINSWIKEQKDSRPSPVLAHQIAGRGRPRVFRLLAHRTEAWREDPYAELLQGRLEIFDRMSGYVPLDDLTEVVFSLDRTEGQPFTDAEQATFELALQGLRPVATVLLGSHGWLPGQERLTPREREALSYLLGPLPEKLIADQMGLATSSTHQHVISVYRKMGVTSRAELMSVWARLTSPELPFE